MSTRDIEATFADVLSGTGRVEVSVSRVTRCLSEDFEAFRKRDLSNSCISSSTARTYATTREPDSRRHRLSR